MAQVPIPLTTLSSPSTQSTSHPSRRSPMICPLAKLGRSSPAMDETRYGSPSVEVGCRRSNLMEPSSSRPYMRGLPSPLEPSIFIHQPPLRVSESNGYRNASPSPKDNQKTFRNVTPNPSESNFRCFPNSVSEPYYRNGNPVGSGYYSMMPLTENRQEMQNFFSPSSSEGEPSSLNQQKRGNKTPIPGESSGKNGEMSLYLQCLINKGHVPHDSMRSSPTLRRTSSPTVDHPFLYHTTDLDANYKVGRSSPSLDQGYHTLVSPSSGPSTPSPWTDYNLSSPSATSGVKSKKFPGSKCSSKSFFEKLPDEAVIRIFSWLDSSDLCICARVCKRWKSLAWEPRLWRVIKLSGENVCGDKAVRSVLRRLCGHGTTGACPTVEKVLLSDGAKITDKGLFQLAKRCTELTHLQLHGCSAVTNSAIFELATKCTNLQHLDLTGCSRISCLSVTACAEPARLLLQYLDLTDCPAVDDSGLKIIVRNCPQLVYLYLRRCVQITDTGIKFLPSFCSMLRELSVSDCHRVTDFALHELAKLGATLRYLSVAKCDQVSDAGLKVIARRCYKLRYLNARGCEAVSDDAITVLARSCPRLRALDIGKCDVSDAGLRALAESCPNLKKLSLRNCDLVTDRGVQCIAYYCRGLQQLNIQDCQISIEGYRAVKKYCKRCVIEHTNPGFF